LPVPFVIDADSLAPDPAWPPPVVRSCHHDLLDMWQRIGLLVHDGESFEDSSLGQAVSDLPQSLKVLWQAVLERSPPIPCRNNWNGSVTPGAAIEICNVASLALLDDTHAEVDFGIEEDQDETSIVPTNNHRLIVSRLIAANNATVIKEALHASQSPIKAGERYQEIWNTRFRSISSSPSPNLKKVSIVDRYAVEKHFRCPEDRLSGLERFLRLLDGDAGGTRYVTLYSAWTADLGNRNSKDVETEMVAVL
jgi:hypothetical protein